ncbi:helix-turn-helix transcriptional regulator [Micromonospora sonneratiae]|uniref:Helix-turn-helix transcriptional regulator n=1 Tax=Micromonospora sonneratiae TaxID=1184706 RepID=A0ABW3YI49_9ACTN
MASELGDFLRARRNRTQPADLGLMPGGTRRVSGLRRDELALLAGVSSDYYTRIEQGRVRPSEQVLGALARVLRLDGTEREHLLRLAHRSPRTTIPHRPGEVVAAGTLDLLDRLDDLPAIVLGRTLDALAWTPLGAALLALTDDGERNMARRTFLLPETRQLYPDWDAVAAELVAHLRRLSAQRGTHGELAELIDELTVASGEFAALWSRHDVTAGVARRKTFHHRLAGTFELEPEVLTLTRDEQTLCIYRAVPDSPGADALALLNTLVASGLASTNQQPAGIGADIAG